MAYQAWSVIAGEQPTAAKWNILGTNDAGFNDGTAIGTSAIVAGLIASGAVTGSKLNLGLSSNVIRYDGGGTTSYTIAGTSYSDVTGLTQPSITFAAGSAIMIGTVRVQQGSGTSMDISLQPLINGVAADYPTAGTFFETFSSVTSNNSVNMGFFAVWKSISAGTYTCKIQASRSGGTANVLTTNSAVLVLQTNA